MGWRRRRHGRRSQSNQDDAGKKILILADSKAAIAAVKKAGKTGKARTRHLHRTVNMIAEVKKEGGKVKIEWVKAHMSILGNEAADVLAKDAAEGVPLDDHEKWMSGGGYKTVGKAEVEGKCGGRRGYKNGGGRRLQTTADCEEERASGGGGMTR